MFEALWAGLLLWSLTSYQARPQSFLLIISWLWTYLIAYINHIPIIVLVDFWAFPVSLYIAMRFSGCGGLWSWVIVAGHASYIIGHLLLWGTWHVTGSWYGDALYWFTRGVFTLQCLAACWPALRPMRRRTRRKAFGRRRDSDRAWITRWRR